MRRRLQSQLSRAKEIDDGRIQEFQGGAWLGTTECSGGRLESQPGTSGEGGGNGDVGLGRLRPAGDEAQRPEQVEEQSGAGEESGAARVFVRGAPCPKCGRPSGRGMFVHVEHCKGVRDAGGT